MWGTTNAPAHRPQIESPHTDHVVHRLLVSGRHWDGARDGHPEAWNQTSELGFK